MPKPEYFVGPFFKWKLEGDTATIVQVTGRCGGPKAWLGQPHHLKNIEEWKAKGITKVVLWFPSKFLDLAKEYCSQHGFTLEVLIEKDEAIKCRITIA